jgi:uncharacterized protein DUF4440
MKRCPTCNRTFTDEHLSFCLDDGTPLQRVDTSSEEPTLVLPDEATLVLPSSGKAETSSAGTSATEPTIAAYQPPGSYIPPGLGGQQSKRKTWPWVVGILAVLLIIFGGLGIAAAIFIPRMMRAASNTNTSNLNANVNRSNNENSNLSGSNSNSAEENVNDNSDEGDTTSPPTNEDEVLAQLTDLEHEWTAANINADKKKLDRILADDYVGKSSDGKTQGKAEYLRTIERDTTIQKWDFEDLKVSLIGDRATLSGIIRLQVQDKEIAYRFTDKFVWRDGRWQAIRSEVAPLE